MEAVLKNVSLNTYEIKKGENKGKKFKKLDFTVDVLVDAKKGEIKTRTGILYVTINKDTSFLLVRRDA